MWHGMCTSLRGEDLSSRISWTSGTDPRSFCSRFFPPSNISTGNTNIAMLILFNWIRRYCPQGLHQPSSRAGTVGDSASRTLYLCWMGSGRSAEVTPSGCYFRVFPKHICSHPLLLCFFQLVVTRWRYALEDNLSEIRGGCQSLLWQAHFSDKAVDGEFNSKFWNLSVGLNGEKHFLCFSQFEEGGPIIGVQLENEYGSFGKDNNYMPFIKDVSFPTGNYVVCSNLQGFVQSIQHITFLASISVSPNKRHQGAPADFRQLGGPAIRRDGGR